MPTRLTTFLAEAGAGGALGSVAVATALGIPVTLFGPEPTHAAAAARVVAKTRIEGGARMEVEHLTQERTRDEPSGREVACLSHLNQPSP